MDAILLDEITSAVREADDWFKKIGGSSRHWVDDCFLPMLKKRGIDIFKAQEVYDCESRLAAAEAERDELQRHCESYKAAYDAILADLKIMEQKLNDLQVENSRLIRIGEERHIRAKDTEEGLMEHVERLQAENERLLRCLADYPAGNQTEPDVKAALREVDGGKD